MCFLDLMKQCEKIAANMPKEELKDLQVFCHGEEIVDVKLLEDVLNLGYDRPLKVQKLLLKTKREK